MKSYLKTKAVEVEGIGEITVRELSVKAHNEILSFQKDNVEHMPALAAKLGVPEWSDETVEDIESNVSIQALSELMRAIFSLSGLDLVTADQAVNGEDKSPKKDLQVVPSESSSTA